MESGYVKVANFVWTEHNRTSQYYKSYTKTLGNQDPITHTILKHHSNAGTKNS